MEFDVLWWVFGIILHFCHAYPNIRDGFYNLPSKFKGGFIIYILIIIDQGSLIWILFFYNFILKRRDGHILNYKDTSGFMQYIHIVLFLEWYISYHKTNNYDIKSTPQYNGILAINAQMLSNNNNVTKNLPKCCHYQNCHNQ